MAIFSPKMRLKRVDFPTLGLPRMEIKPDLKDAMTGQKYEIPAYRQAGEYRNPKQIQNLKVKTFLYGKLEFGYSCLFRLPAGRQEFRASYFEFRSKIYQGNQISAIPHRNSITRFTKGGSDQSPLENVPPEPGSSPFLRNLESR
jgi:hypothetical protein